MLISMHFSLGLPDVPPAPNKAISRVGTLRLADLSGFFKKIK